MLAPVRSRPPRTAASFAVALLLAGGGAAAIPSAASAASPAPARCVVRGGDLVRTGHFARLWTKQVETSGGPAIRVYACLRSQRPRLLETYDNALTLRVSRVIFDRAAVGFRVRATDADCSKYTPADPACETDALRGFAFAGRRARLRASVVDPGGVAGLDVTKRGRLVWVTRPAADGQRRLYTTRGRATTLVDTGAIDPRTVGVSVDGVTFGWEKDGVAMSGRLD